jgi:hypothetical protein
MLSSAWRVASGVKPRACSVCATSREPEGRDPQQPHLARPPREVLHHAQRAGVAPVQVLEHEHERPVGGEAVHELAHLAHHAILVRAADIRVQVRAIRFAHQPRHLHQPGRRHAAH